MNPTPTTCIATSFGIPKRLQASGIRRSDPPATPEAPAALAAARAHRISAVGKFYVDIQCMCCGKCHGGDCNSSSCHIDSCAKWNGDGVSILVQTKILAEFHVDRNVGSRASGEECCQSTVFQATKYKWVWVLRRKINVISGFIISATKSMVPTSTQIRRPYPRRTSSPCSEIVVKISPMIPNGAQLMIHLLQSR